MTRPSKSFDDKRTTIVKVRFTPAEKKALSELAEAAGLTPSDFVRLKTIGGQPHIKRATPERATFIKALAELNKIGSNVNQIAKTLNTDFARLQNISVSPELIASTLYGLQTLSKNMIKHLENGD